MHIKYLFTGIKGNQPARCELSRRIGKEGNRRRGVWMDGHVCGSTDGLMVKKNKRQVVVICIGVCGVRSIMQISTS